MLAATTWQDVAIEFVKQLAAILGAAAILLGVVYKFWIRDFKAKQDESLENQKRLEAKANAIETKADGNHTRALEAVKETSRYTSDQIIKAVEKVLSAQAPRRAEKRSTDPDPAEVQAPKRGRRSTDKKEPDT